jgi:hypothetical protein
MNFVSASDPNVLVMGRVERANGKLRIGYPGVTLRLRFEGNALALRAESTGESSRLEVRVDTQTPRILPVKRGDSELTLAENLPKGVHSLELVHRTETWQGIVTISGFRLDPAAHLLPPEPWPARRLLLIGDSVTCGEAVERSPDCQKNSDWWNPSRSYGMLLARSLGAQCHLVCYGGRGLIRDWQGRRDTLNAPQFFELAVPDPARPASWKHERYVPDVVLVSLGTNDFNLALGALPEREEYVAAYVAFVKRIRVSYPDAQVLLTEGAMVNDEVDPNRPQKRTLREYLAETVRRVADAKVQVIESRHYPGDRCDAHPTGDQHQAMARDLEPEVRRVAGW